MIIFEQVFIYFVTCCLALLVRDSSGFYCTYLSHLLMTFLTNKALKDLESNLQQGFFLLGSCGSAMTERYVYLMNVVTVSYVVLKSDQGLQSNFMQTPT